MKRQSFVLLGGAGLFGLPVLAAAQETTSAHRVALLLNGPPEEPELQRRFAVFRNGLRALGWAEGKNVTVVARWVPDQQAGPMRDAAAALLATKPDVILTSGAPATRTVIAATREAPLIFVAVSDPLAQGIVLNPARPGGNVTGFANVEFSLGGKWMQLLKEIAPRVRRVFAMWSPGEANGWLRSLRAAAPAVSLHLQEVRVETEADIEATFAGLSSGAEAGLVVGPGGFGRAHHRQIIALAVRHRVPAVYPYAYYVADGGLASYGNDPVDSFRLAAGYVDHILKGEKPGDLPVQFPTKIRLAINLTTARTLGLNLPRSLLLQADEVVH